MPLQPTDIHALHAVSNPTLSPAGDTLIYVQVSTCAARGTTPSRLMIYRQGEGRARPFSAGPQDAAPRYAPDGQQIGFLRPGAGTQVKQLWLLSTRGGEAHQLTELPGGVRDFAWAPDSTRLVVVARVDPEAADPESEVPKTQVARRIRYRDDGEGWRGEAFSQLFVIAAEGGEARQLTSAEGDHLAPVWSPAGDRIAFISDAVEERDWSNFSAARVIAAEGGEAHTWSADLVRLDSLAWSPDGSRLAAAGAHDPEVWDARQAWLYVLAPGAPARQIAGATHTIVQPLAERCWTADDQLLYIADRGGESSLCRIPAGGGEAVVIEGGGKTFTALQIDAAGRRAALVAGADAVPGDLYFVELESRAARYLTSVNDTFLRDHPAAAVEEFSCVRQGWQLPARLLFPADFDAAQEYPLVLDIHGGPNGRFSASYDLTQQLLCGAGYLVLAVNPRGSSSYGPEFLNAVLRDWGGEDFLDLMAAVEQVCQRPYVDAHRLGVHGYSYGGFMSSWIIGRDHRFKAAVIGAPCTNLHSMYGTSDIGVSFGEIQWGGTSFERVEALHERSPLSYAAAVQTPALLLHGELDYRCPIEQSEQFFVALKRQRKKVELVRFPGASHGFRKTAHPALREEYYRRMLDWFAQFV